MARAMPVMSISRPRNTNSGTASSTRLLMPSSMRDTTIVSGTFVTHIRKATVAVPKAKPIGTPSSTPAASSRTKKKTRFQLPIAFRTGARKNRAPVSTARTITTASRGFQGKRTIRSAPLSSISAAPVGMAAARTMLGRPSAGVSI